VLFRSADRDPCDEVEVVCRGGHVVEIRLARSLKVRGVDVAEFAGLLSLEHLDLSHTEVYGDVTALSALSSLVELNLRATGVFGDVQSLGSLTGLRVLRLGGSDTQGNLSGDISGLQRLVKLRELEISGSDRVVGFLKALVPLQSLQVLVLDDTQTEGDLNALAPLTQLRELSLAFTNVMGDIAPLAALTQLEVLILQGTMQHAEIKRSRLLTIKKPFVMQEFMEELGVWLDDDTLVVEGFQNDHGILDGWNKEDQLLAVNGRSVHTWSQVLFELSLVKEKAQLPIVFSVLRGVRGDVRGLRNLTSLRVLSLGDTVVGGDVGELEGLRNLTRLELWGTSLTGDVTQLAPLKSLSHLNLQDTGISCPEGCRDWVGTRAVRTVLGGTSGILPT